MAGAVIQFFIWCAIGAAVGLLAGLVMGSNGKVVHVEDILVGVFGAFIGGQLVPSLMAADGLVPTGMSFGAVLSGVAGACVLLGLLRLMRRAVGPMRGRKSRAGSHR